MKIENPFKINASDDSSTQIVFKSQNESLNRRMRNYPLSAKISIEKMQTPHITEQEQWHNQSSTSNQLRSRNKPKEVFNVNPEAEGRKTAEKFVHENPSSDENPFSLLFNHQRNHKFCSPQNETSTKLSNRIHNKTKWNFQTSKEGLRPNWSPP